MIAYNEELPPIKSHDYLIKWSCEVTWQIKYITSPLPLRQWSPNMQGGGLLWEASTDKVTQPFIYERNGLKKTVWENVWQVSPIPISSNQNRLHYSLNCIFTEFIMIRLMTMTILVTKMTSKMWQNRRYIHEMYVM